jgi:hypothetical protein
METCQSGRMYLFAKEAGSSKGPEGSNPSVSACFERSEKLRDEKVHDCTFVRGEKSLSISHGAVGEYDTKTVPNM